MAVTSLSTAASPGIYIVLSHRTNVRRDIGNPFVRPSVRPFVRRITRIYFDRLGSYFTYIWPVGIQPRLRMEFSRWPPVPRCPSFSKWLPCALVRRNNLNMPWRIGIICVLGVPVLLLMEFSKWSTVPKWLLVRVIFERQVVTNVAWPSSHSRPVARLEYALCLLLVFTNSYIPHCCYSLCYLCWLGVLLEYFTVGRSDVYCGTHMVWGLKYETGIISPKRIFPTCTYMWHRAGIVYVLFILLTVACYACWTTYR